MEGLDVPMLDSLIQKADVEEASELYVHFARLTAHAQTRIMACWREAGPRLTARNGDQWLTPAEAAGRLKVHPKWLYRRRGKPGFEFIEPLENGGRGIRISERRLVAYMSARRR